MPYAYPKRNSREYAKQQYWNDGSFDTTPWIQFTGKPIMLAFLKQLMIPILNDKASSLAFLDHGFITTRDGALAYVPKNIQKL